MTKPTSIFKSSYSKNKVWSTTLTQQNSINSSPMCNLPNFRLPLHFKHTTVLLWKNHHLLSKTINRTIVRQKLKPQDLHHLHPLLKKQKSKCKKSNKRIKNKRRYLKTLKTISRLYNSHQKRLKLKHQVKALTLWQNSFHLKKKMMLRNLLRIEKYQRRKKVM
jgi:hypothetical protein